MIKLNNNNIVSFNLAPATAPLDMSKESIKEIAARKGSFKVSKARTELVEVSGNKYKATVELPLAEDVRLATPSSTSILFVNNLPISNGSINDSNVASRRKVMAQHLGLDDLSGLVALPLPTATSKAFYLPRTVKLKSVASKELFPIYWSLALEVALGVANTSLPVGMPSVHGLTIQMSKKLSSLSFIKHPDYVAHAIVSELVEYGYMQILVARQKVKGSFKKERLIKLDNPISLDFLETIADVSKRVELRSHGVITDGSQDMEFNRHNSLLGSTNENSAAKASVSCIIDQEFTVRPFIYDLLDVLNNKYLPENNSTTAALSSMKDRLGTTFTFSGMADSRTRLYTLAGSGANTQGSDAQKALVCFSKSISIDDISFWKLMGAANDYASAASTLSIETMTKHVLEAREVLSGELPKTKANLEWLSYDKPYSYMAIAQEVVDYNANGYGESFSPVPLDGRCSGIQHLSAMSLSPAVVDMIGMHHVESDVDVYESLAAELLTTSGLLAMRTKLTTAKSKGILIYSVEEVSSIMQVLEATICRKFCKNIVMTFAYGAGASTAGEGLFAKFGGDLSEGKIPEAACMVVGRYMHSQLGSKLKGLTGIMDDLKSWIDVISSADKNGKNVKETSKSLIKKGNRKNVAIGWVTPDNLLAYQEYPTLAEMKVEYVAHSGSVEKVKLARQDYSMPDTKKHRSAIAPNIIHSLDATHLRMVARRMEEAGMQMVFIHDSFGTTADRVDELHAIIVEEFIKIYQGDYMLDLKKYWEETYNVSLSAPRAQGNFDINTMVGLTKFFT